MSAMASQITGVSSDCSTVCSSADQRKHQNSASLAFVRGIHRWPVVSPHKGPVTRKTFPFDDVIMEYSLGCSVYAIPQNRFYQMYFHQSSPLDIWFDILHFATLSLMYTRMKLVICRSHGLHYLFYLAPVVTLLQTNINSVTNDAFVRP